MSKPSGNQAFGQAIRQLRTEAGLSQERLALESGVDRSYLGGVERGQRNPSLRNVLKIAAGLGVPPSALFGRFEGIVQRSDTTDDVI